jgi:ribosome-binding factor A
MTRRRTGGRSRSSGARRPAAAGVRSGSGGTARDYPRTARLNQLVQEIVAEEIERLEDDRLGFLTVVAVEVEPDLRRAIVWYTSLADALPGGPGPEMASGGGGGGGDTRPAPRTGESGEDREELVEALEEHRPRLQAAIARQARLKRTPELRFEPDPVTRQAQRVEAILRDIGADE